MNPEKLSSDNTVYNYQGSIPEGELRAREVKKSPFPRVERARQLYFDTKSSASVEFP